MRQMLVCGFNPAGPAWDAAGPMPKLPTAPRRAAPAPVPDRSAEEVRADIRWGERDEVFDLVSRGGLGGHEVKATRQKVHGGPRKWRAWEERGERRPSAAERRRSIDSW